MRAFGAGMLVFISVLMPTVSVPAGNAASGMAAEDVAFVAGIDGSMQRYVVVPPPGCREGGTHDALIALHGHGSDRWQFVRDGRDECRAARDTAARHGMLYVSPDYRAATSWMGPKAEADLVQIISAVKSRCRDGRVFLCGGSMGGTACLAFAVRHPELVDGVALMNGTANLVEYGNFQDAIAASYGGTKEQVPEEYRSRSAEFFPERLTMPVGITAGGRDESVPAASVLRLAGKLKSLGRDVLLIYREDGGHATDYGDAVSILEFVLERARKEGRGPGRETAPPGPR